MNNACIDNMTTVNYFIYGASVVPFIVFSSIVLSSLCFLTTTNYKSKLIDEYDEEEEEIEIPYTEKYKLTSDICEDIDKLENNFVIDNTPNGNVLMQWNDDDNLWEWWADSKYKNNISYAELETVSRKFCNVYKCGNLYIDRSVELEEMKKKQEEEERQQKENEEKMEKEEENNSDDDLFVKPKKVVSTNNKKDKELVPEKANVYRYKGKINDCSNVFHRKYTKEEEVEKTVNWSSWKLLSGSSQ